MLLLLLILESFFTPAIADGFSLWQQVFQVSRTLLSILVNLNNAVAPRWFLLVLWFLNLWVLLPNLWGIVLSAPITIGITATFMFHSFFVVLWPGLRNYLSFHFLLFFSLWSTSTVNSCAHFLLTMTKSGRLAEIRWTICILKSQKFVCISFSWTDSGLHIYHLFAWSNFTFFSTISSESPFSCTIPSESPFLPSRV